MSDSVNKYNKSINEIEKKWGKYETYIIERDNPEDVKFATKQKAKINAAINDVETARKDFRNELLKPYEENKHVFENMVAKLNTINSNLSTQLLEISEDEKKSKKNAVLDLIDEIVETELLCEDFRKSFVVENLKTKKFNKKWLNKSTSMKAIEKDIIMDVEKYQSDFDIIDNFDDVAKKAYFEDNLNVNDAIAFSKKVASYNEVAPAPEEQKKETKKIYNATFTVDNLDDLEVIKRFAQASELKLEIR